MVVLVRPKIQADAIVNPAPRERDGAFISDADAPPNALYIAMGFPCASLDPDVKLLFLVAFEQLLDGLAEQNRLGHLQLFGYPVELVNLPLKKVRRNRNLFMRFFLSHRMY